MDKISKCQNDIGDKAIKNTSIFSKINNLINSCFGRNRIYNDDKDNHYSIRQDDFENIMNGEYTRFMNIDT